MIIDRFYFGKTSKGEVVYRYTIKNKAGTEVSVITYGAAVQKIIFDGKDVLLGFDSVSDYEKQDKYMGAVVGRFANRIGSGKFTLNGTEYSLFVNNGPNSLHGGKEGFDKKVWNGHFTEKGLLLSTVSNDMEEGYPGEMKIYVLYSLDDENNFSIEYTAISDKDTIINLTNHSYFNLGGHDKGTLKDHIVFIDSDKFTENDENSLPTGNIIDVEGTPMDFRKPKNILENIDDDYYQLKLGNGYDINYVLKNNSVCAYAYDSESNIKMEVITDRPGVQLYTGNFLDGEVKGKNGAFYGKRSGICFETQGFPDAINKENFPSCVLKAGEEFKSKTVYKFTKI